MGTHGRGGGGGVGLPRQLRVYPPKHKPNMFCNMSAFCTSVMLDISWSASKVLTKQQGPTATCYCFLNTNLGANKDNLKCRIYQCLSGLDYLDHKVHIYKEYQSVCPLVAIGTLPPPLSPASVTLPTEPKGGGHTRLAGEGLGESQFRRLGEKLSTLPTL